MIVKKVEKKGKKYVITFEEEVIEVTEETVLHFRLTKHKEINHSINDIKEKDFYYQLYEKTLRKLRYPKSSFEIRTFLESEKLEEKLITKLISELIDKKLLDDERLMKNIIEFTNKSRTKIKTKLIQKGFKQEDFQYILEDKDESQYLLKDFHKLATKYQKLNKMVAKTKIERSLLAKGYTYSNIKTVMPQIESYQFNTKAISEDYQKWYKKYEDKSKTIQKLLSLGYPYDEIKNIIE